MKLISQEALYTSFETESREEWGNRITEALGPDADPSIKDHCIGSRPEHSYPKWQHQFEIGECFSVSSHDPAQLKEVNSQILSALDGGVQHIYLRVDVSLDERAVEKLFQGVKLDYINTTLVINKKHNISLPQSWDSRYYTIRDESNPVIALDCAEKPDIAIAHCMQYVAKVMDRSDQQKTAPPFTISVAVGDSYLMEIARLRALHHTFNLLNSHYDWQHSLRIEASYHLNATSVSDYQKIANTTHGLAAILGGATVVLPFGLEQTDGEEVRIARNQLHLLRLESYIDKVSDPLAGSHTIEYRTDLIAKAAWERLTKLQTTWRKYW